MSRSEQESPFSAAVPPVARQMPHVTRIHGREVTDEYHWMRAREDAEVIEYLEAENAYAREVTRSLDGLRNELFDEMRARIAEADTTVPDEIGAYAYYYRSEKGKQHPLFCRRPRSQRGDEDVLLDLNAIARDHAFLHAGAIRVSPDHRLLAYTIDTSGREKYTLRVVNLESRGQVSRAIGNTSGEVEWGNDGRTLFFVELDDAFRPHELCRFHLEDPEASPISLYRESDERFSIELSKSKSRRFIFAMVASAVTSEVHYLDADRPRASPRLFAPRRQSVEYAIEHRGDSFYVLTNEDAVNFKVMEAQVLGASRQSWQEVVAHRDDVALEHMELFRNHLAIYCRAAGVPKIEIRNLSNESTHVLPSREQAYALSSREHPDFDSPVLRFEYSSMVTPTSVFDYDMERRQRALRKAVVVGGGYDPGSYLTERIHAVAADGVEVPITVAHRKGLALDGSNPCLLTGYGAYGINLDPAFDPLRTVLLDRGFVCAIAHVRGGGELGRRWYLDGAMSNKRNSFTDFIAAAEHLIARGYTSSHRLALYGKSAGGLLIGAVLNARPELAAAAVADVPFVDVINTMLDDSLPLTVNEYEEWGDPHDPSQFEYMYSYSPYDNVTASSYPALLIRAALEDSRVQYWEPAKWAARLRATKLDQSPLLLVTSSNASHSRAAGRYESLRQRAYDYAFLLAALGMVESPSQYAGLP